jgi:hypothetical protein
LELSIDVSLTLDSTAQKDCSETEPAYDRRLLGHASQASGIESHE